MGPHPNYNLNTTFKQHESLYLFSSLFLLLLAVYVVLYSLQMTFGLNSIHAHRTLDNTFRDKLVAISEFCQGSKKAMQDDRVLFFLALSKEANSQRLFLVLSYPAGQPHRGLHTSLISAPLILLEKSL